MRDINLRSEHNGIRTHWLIRLWGPYGNPLARLCRGLWRGFSWDDWELSLRCYRDSQGECYCPHGREQQFGFCLLGFGVRVWRSVSWVPRPCVCTKVVWCVLPDANAGDIEDYGRERLAAEFPEYAEKLLEGSEVR